MLVETQEDLTRVIHCLASSSNKIVVDTETNWTDRFHERYCMGIALEIDGLTYYIPVGHNSWMTPNAQNLTVPTDLLQHVRSELVFHNAKFDIHVLSKLGIHIPSHVRVYDTMIMAHLLNENLFDYELETLATITLGDGEGKDKRLKPFKKDEWDSVPSFAMAVYAERDVAVTGRVYDKLKKVFADFEPVWAVDEQFMYLLQKMEQKGLILDRSLAAKLQVDCLAHIEELIAKIGVNPSKRTKLIELLFSEPPVGYGLTPISKTKGGRPQANKKFFESISHPVGKLLREWSELNKLYTSYYNPYLHLTEGYDRIHASFKQHGTVTGRLSCADPNMHQIPRDSPIKKLFLAEPGKELWEIDFSALEPRLAAVYSREPKLLDVFENGGDYHQMTASALNLSRQQGKGMNLTMLYGGGAPAITNLLGCDIKTAYSHSNKFWGTYNVLSSFKDTVNATAEKNGEIKMWSGRRRRFPYRGDARKAFNSLIQGGGFEIVKKATMLLDEAGFDIRNQVHDSVWLMVDSEKDIPEAEHVMADWTKKAFGLHFAVESKRLN